MRLRGISARSALCALAFAVLPSSGDRAAAGARATQGPQESNRYSVAGFDTADEAESFLRELQRAAAAGERERIATLVEYPITVRVGRRRVTLRRKADLVRRYDSVFTRNVKDALARQEPSQLFTNSRGVMVGNGQIWFAPLAGGNGRVRIIAVNTDAP